MVQAWTTNDWRLDIFCRRHLYHGKTVFLSQSADGHLLQNMFQPVRWDFLSSLTLLCWCTDLNTHANNAKLTWLPHYPQPKFLQGFFFSTISLQIWKQKQCRESYYCYVQCTFLIKELKRQENTETPKPAVPLMSTWGSTKSLIMIFQTFYWHTKKKKHVHTGDITLRLKPDHSSSSPPDVCKAVLFCQGKQGGQCLPNEKTNCYFSILTFSTLSDRIWSSGWS